MKKNIFNTLAIILIVFSSCTKKYSCKCTTTLSEAGYVPNTTQTTEEFKKNTSKKKATQICNNTAKQMQANTDSLFTNPDISVTTNCILKDY